MNVLLWGRETRRGWVGLATKYLTWPYEVIPWFAEGVLMSGMPDLLALDICALLGNAFLRHETVPSANLSRATRGVYAR